MISRIHKALEEREEGFTLIELLVVVIIIGILAAIAIPVFLAQRNKAYNSGAQSDLHSAATAEEAYLTDNPTGGYTTSSSSLATDGFKGTGGVTLVVSTIGATGYCMVASNTNNSANQWYVYDSTNGGMQPTPQSSYTAAQGQCNTADTWTGWTAIEGTAP